MVAGESRADVRGYRFQVRQYEWALTTGDPLPAVDPFRTARRWTVVSFCCAALLLAGFGVAGLIHPAPRWQDAAVLLDTDSGTAYLNRNGVLHPALNLTSALLAVDGGAPLDLEQVRADDLATAPRGALIGIVGAPGRPPAADALITDQWSVCDQQETTTVVIGEPPPGLPLPSDQGLFVHGTDADYLVWDGRRSRIDSTDPVLRQALRLDGVPSRPLSAALLTAIPETAPLTVPVVPDAGSATRGFTISADGVGTLTVGSIFRVARAAGGITLHLVRQDGVEQISPLAADLLQFAGSPLIPDPVPAQVLAAAPIARSQLVESPARPPVPPRFVVDGAAVICTAWSRTTGWRVLVGSRWGADHAVALPEPRPDGAIDAVVIAPTRGAVVSETTSVTSRILLITDLGIAYPVTSTDALTRLGYPIDPPTVPPQISSLLPVGPTLDPAAAGQQWGGLPQSESKGSAESAVSMTTPLPVASARSADGTSGGPPER